MAENVFFTGCVLPDAYTRFVDSVWGKIKDFKEVEAINALICDYLEIENKKYEEQRGGADCNFTFEPLPRIIINALFDNDVLHHIFDTRAGHDDIEIQKICNKCIFESDAKSETSKETIRKIVRNCIGIVKTYYEKKMTISELARNKRLADDISENIVEAQKKEIRNHDAKEKARNERFEGKIDEMSKELASIGRKLDSSAAGLLAASSKPSVSGGPATKTTTASVAGSHATPSSPSISGSASTKTVLMSKMPSYAQNAKEINDVLSWNQTADELKVEVDELKELTDILKDIPETTRKILARMVLLAEYDGWDHYRFTIEALAAYFPNTDLAGHSDILVNKDIITDFDPEDYSSCGRDWRWFPRGLKWNYWEDIKQFCELKGINIEQVIVKLDFSVFDK